jgi:hypothetical protein
MNENAFLTTNLSKPLHLPSSLFSEISLENKSLNSRNIMNPQMFFNIKNKIRSKSHHYPNDML